MQPRSIVAPGSPARLTQQQDIPNTPQSPRRNTPQLYQRQYQDLLKTVGPHGGLGDPVFELDNLIGTLMHEVGTECAKAALPAKESSMKDICRQISSAIKSADECFDRSEFDAARTHLLAAKGNQVKLLGQIDGLKQDTEGEQEYSQPRVTCENIGIRISLLMQLVQERMKQQAKVSKQPDSLTSSPRRHGALGPDSRAEKPASEKQARSPGKRSQDDQDSPQMKKSPAKRHKPDSGQPDAAPLSPPRQHASTSPARASASVAPASATGVMPSSANSASISVTKPAWKTIRPADNLSPHPLPTTPRSPGRSQTSAAPAPPHEPLATGPVAAGGAGEKNDTRKETTTTTTTTASGNPDANPSSQATGQAQQPTSPRRGGVKLTTPGPRPRPPSALFAAPIDFSKGIEQAPRSPRLPENRAASTQGTQPPQQPSDSASNSQS